MKNLLILSILIFTISCSNLSNSRNLEAKREQRFSIEQDTSYKDNSLDIERIKRNFYKYGNNKDESILIHQQLLGEKYYSIYMRSDGKSGAAIFNNDKEFEKFIQDMKTVSNNYKKNLNFTFGSQAGKISAYGEDRIWLSVSNLNNEITLLNINKSEIDSIESCYIKYKKEKE